MGVDVTGLKRVLNLRVLMCEFHKISIWLNSLVFKGSPPVAINGTADSVFCRSSLAVLQQI